MAPLRSEGIANAKAPVTAEKEARKKILAAISPLACEQLHLANALNYLLRESLARSLLCRLSITPPWMDLRSSPAAREKARG